MASLVLTVGGVSGTVTAADAKAAAVLSAFADSVGATGTNQERAQAVVVALVRYMVTQAKAQTWRKAQAAAGEAVQAEVDGLDFGT